MLIETNVLPLSRTAKPTKIVWRVVTLVIIIIIILLLLLLPNSKQTDSNYMTAFVSVIVVAARGEVS